MPGTRKPRPSENRRAAIYARVSDRSQAEDDKTSLAEQIGDMEAYCEERGYTITARYQEVGRGWSKQRPEFQRMLADAAAGRFDTIVCWKSDRLSRGMYPAAALMEVVEAQRIAIEAVMDAIDMKTFGLMAAIGKIELDNFRERASMGKRGTAKQGRIPVNCVPFGYRITEEGEPAVDEEQAEVVRRIFRQYVHEGMGGLAIAQQLTSEGVPTSGRASRWHAPQVNRILRNETYLGTWWYGKARHIATDDGTRIHEQPRDSWIGVPFPPLVDEETWRQAQAVRERRRIRSPRNTKVFHLLQHLVRCSECGLLMGPLAKRRQTVRRGGKTYRYEFERPRRYYQCYGMKAPHSLRCRERPMIRAERLETLVWGEVKRVLEHPDLIVAGLAALEGDADDDVAGEVARTERELAGVQLEEDRAIRLYVTGKISEEQLDHQRRFIGERLERLRARLDEYRARATAHVDQRLVLERVVEWTQRVGDGLDDLPEEERRELLNLLLDEATIDGENNVTLTLAIPGDGDVVSIAEQGPPTTDHRPPTTDHRPPTTSHYPQLPLYSTGVSLTAEYRTQLVARLRATTADLAWAVRDLPGDQHRWTPDPDEWSIHEHVAHLVDMEEQVYLPLLRWAAIPDMLEPADYSRRVWRDERYDVGAPLGDLMEQLGRVRDEEFDVFRELDDAAWLHLRDDGHWGPVTCQWIAEVVYRHALDHLQGVMGLRGDLNLAALDRGVAGGV